MNGLEVWIDPISEKEVGFLGAWETVNGKRKILTRISFLGNEMVDSRRIAFSLPKTTLTSVRWASGGIADEKAFLSAFSSDQVKRGEKCSIRSKLQVFR